MGMTPSAKVRWRTEKELREREARGEVVKAPRRHDPSPPIPTLGQLHTAPRWFWLHCTNWRCAHQAPIPLAPLIIRWGPNASSDLLRTLPRCSVCGTKGAYTFHPSYVDMDIQPFPAHRVAIFQTGKLPIACRASPASRWPQGAHLFCYDRQTGS